MDTGTKLQGELWSRAPISGSILAPAGLLAAEAKARVNPARGPQANSPSEAHAVLAMVDRDIFMTVADDDRVRWAAALITHMRNIKAGTAHSSLKTPRSGQGRPLGHATARPGVTTRYAQTITQQHHEYVVCTRTQQHSLKSDSRPVAMGVLTGPGS